jgi:hypothetical protein
MEDEIEIVKNNVKIQVKILKKQKLKKLQDLTIAHNVVHYTSKNIQMQMKKLYLVHH